MGLRSPVSRVNIAGANHGQSLGFTTHLMDPIPSVSSHTPSIPMPQICPLTFFSPVDQARFCCGYIIYAGTNVILVSTSARAAERGVEAQL